MKWRTQLIIRHQRLQLIEMRCVSHSFTIVFVLIFQPYDYSICFLWDPDAEVPFEVFSEQELPDEIKSWLSRDVSPLRFNKFIIPSMGIERDYSLFCRIQAGVPMIKKLEERNRLMEMYFRSLDSGLTMMQAYKQLTVICPTSIETDETPKRTTRNSQVQSFSHL